MRRFLQPEQDAPEPWHHTGRKPRRIVALAQRPQALVPDPHEITVTRRKHQPCRHGGDSLAERSHSPALRCGNMCDDRCCVMGTGEPAPPPTVRAERMTLPARVSRALICDLVLPIVTIGSRAVVRGVLPQVRGGRCRLYAARAKCRLHNSFHARQIAQQGSGMGTPVGGWLSYRSAPGPEGQVCS